MEMLKATPGPWSVGAPSGHNANYVFAGDDSVASVFGLPMHTSLEDVPRGGQWENGLANAHLIAAAPALYEALAGMIADHMAIQCKPWPSYPQARAALALARGETSHPESRVGLDPDAGTREPNQEKAS